MTWVTATVARRRPAMAGNYAAWARHGLSYLHDVLVDERYGGLRFRAGADDEKHSYAIAFGIFAAAACARVDADGSGLELAMQLFRWWDARAYDARNGSYADALQRDGSPLLKGRARGRDLIGVPYGERSLNTHLHAVEALTELYRAGGDGAVGARLRALVDSLRTSLLANRGYAFTTYTPGWRPVDRTISYGHDLETVFLILDALAALGDEPEIPDERLLRRALARGLDRRHGGVYLWRAPWRWRPHRVKVDWTQAEALNTLSLLSVREGPLQAACEEALRNVWRFCRRRMIDAEHGGWYSRLHRTGLPLDDRKGHRWKACYHPVRALLNSADCLRPRAGG